MIENIERKLGLFIYRISSEIKIGLVIQKIVLVCQIALKHTLQLFRKILRIHTPMQITLVG